MIRWPHVMCQIYPLVPLNLISIWHSSSVLICRCVYEKNVLTVKVNNWTNINKWYNHLSHQRFQYCSIQSFPIYFNLNILRLSWSKCKPTMNVILFNISECWVSINVLLCYYLQSKTNRVHLLNRSIHMVCFQPGFIYGVQVAQVCPFVLFLCRVRVLSVLRFTASEFHFYRYMYHQTWLTLVNICT